MPRIRSIKPDFPQSESMGRISRNARLTFILLWTVADDSGRTRGNSRMLASLLYPYDEDAPKQIDAWLGELEKENAIRRYEVDGSHYIEIVNWLKHQKIDKPTPSKLPEPREDSRGFASDSRDLPVGREGKGEEEEKERTLARVLPDAERAPVEPNGQRRATRTDRGSQDLLGFEAFYDAYPRKAARGRAEKAWRKLRPGDELRQRILDALARAKTRGKWTDERFIPHPATWLNDRGWEDADLAPPGRNGSMAERFGVSNVV